MGGFFERAGAAIRGVAKRVSPFSEIGVGASVVYGGYLQQPAGDRSRDLNGARRWVKAQQILSDVSIIAASLRYSLNLLARPTWKCDPVNDSAEAKGAAEFMESVLHGTDTSWSRIVRRSGTFRYHGFGIHEWTAKNREDGKIGLASIEPRPQGTIARWDRDPNGGVLGVWQRRPQDGREVYLPREKIVYLVDDTLSDSPEGLGWYRHLIDPAAQIKRYLKLETIGFERDLSGIPVGRAPISAINALIGTKQVPDGEGGMRLFTKADAEEMIQGMRDFVTIKAREPNTGLLIDSQPFTGKMDTGTTVSPVLQWGIDLLTGSSTSIDALGKSIERLAFDMALIMGTESMLIGRQGHGSRALSQDKSHNLYLTINSMLQDMAEACDRDLVSTIWALNGLPEELRPKLKVEDAAFKDAEQIAKTLADMGAAGAILDPNDPAINDVRDLLGVSRQPELSEEMIGLIRGTPPVDDSIPNDPTDPGDPAN